MTSFAEPTPPSQEEPFYIGQHYLYDGFWYYHKFPVKWAKDHRENSGPKKCLNCLAYGTLHNGTLFLGYCVDCARWIYGMKRGYGFVGEGEEASCPIGALQSYLHGIDIDSIPPLICDDDDDDHDPDDISKGSGFLKEEVAAIDDGQVSILECHYEGGYNDF